MGCHENDKREGEEASKYFGSYLAFKVFKIFTIGEKRHCNGKVWACPKSWGWFAAKPLVGSGCREVLWSPSAMFLLLSRDADTCE